MGLHSLSGGEYLKGWAGTPLKRQIVFRRVCGLLLVLFVAACAAPRVRPPAPGAQVGVASWYGPKFHGRPTASGEVFDMHELSAAHRTLPLGTWVQVTHLENGQSIQVRINDRGPFVEGRIIDLSYAAARTLGMVRQGIAWVSVWPLSVVPDYHLAETPQTYTLQVGAFSTEENAVTVKARLDAVTSGAYIDKVSVNRQTFYRVRVGNFDSLEAAKRVAVQVADHGFTVILIDQ